MGIFLRTSAVWHGGMMLRAHHLICLLSFRGLGYYREHVANMSKIVGKASLLPRNLNRDRWQA